MGYFAARSATRMSQWHSSACTVVALMPKSSCIWVGFAFYLVYLFIFGGEYYIIWLIGLLYLCMFVQALKLWKGRLKRIRSLPQRGMPKLLWLFLFICVALALALVWFTCLLIWLNCNFCRKRSTTSEPKSKKAKKDKDPNAPKRPLTAFFLFM